MNEKIFKLINQSYEYVNSMKKLSRADKQDCDKVLLQLANIERLTKSKEPIKLKNFVDYSISKGRGKTEIPMNIMGLILDYQEYVNREIDKHFKD